jgi:hypothetical protein
MDSAPMFILKKDLHIAFLGFLHKFRQRPFLTVHRRWQGLKNPKKNAL